MKAATKSSNLLLLITFFAIFIQSRVINEGLLEQNKQLKAQVQFNTQGNYLFVAVFGANKEEQVVDRTLGETTKAEDSNVIQESDGIEDNQSGQESGQDQEQGQDEYPQRQSQEEQEQTDQLEIQNQQDYQVQSDQDDQQDNGDDNYQDQEKSLLAQNESPGQPTQKVLKFLSNTATSSIQAVKNGFESFSRSFAKRYSKEERPFRLKIFQTNIKQISKHNLARKKKYKKKLNKFADLSKKQFKKRRLMKPISQERRMTAPIPNTQERSAIFRLNKNLANYVDWRVKIQFKEAIDQGECSCCYAFATVGAIELNWAIKYDYTPSLSQQQVLDCCQQSGYKCYGCDTGLMSASYNYMNQYGIADYTNYPYVGFAQDCNEGVTRRSYLNQQQPFYQIYGVENTIYYLVNNGPLSTGVDAQQWQFYQQGVFNDCPAGYVEVNHAVIIGGILQDGSWIIKNSWGTDWGDDGYMILQSGNSCGVTNLAFYPIVD